MKSYVDRKELGEFHLDVEFSPKGNPILMGRELSAVGEAFAQTTESEIRVIEVTDLAVKPESVTFGYTVGSVPKPKPKAKMAETGVRLNTRRFQFSLAGEELMMEESDQTVEGSTLTATAKLKRGWHRSLLAGPWVGKGEAGTVKTRFSHRGFPVIDGVELTRVGQKVGGAEVSVLNVGQHRVELVLKDGSGERSSVWGIDDWMRLVETGSRKVTSTRESRVAGRWEGGSVDKDGKPIAKETFEFDHDSAPILNGERRTQLGQTFRFIPAPKGLNGVGAESHILRSLSRSPDRVAYQIRFETHIKVDDILQDRDYVFTPRDDSDDTLDLVVFGKNGVLYRGTLKRQAAAPEVPADKMPKSGEMPVAQKVTGLVPSTPIKLTEPSPWTGTWFGTVTQNDKTTRDDYFEFTPRGLSLYGYRESGNVRQTMPLEKVGQKFDYESGIERFFVTVRDATFGANRVAYSVNRVKKIGEVTWETNVIARTLSLKENAIGYDYRVTFSERANPNKPPETGKATLERLPPFGGFFAGEYKDRNGLSDGKDSLRVIDGGRPIYYVSHGPSNNYHQFELTHVDQRIVTKQPNGSVFILFVQELDATPFRSAFVVERFSASLDPAIPAKRDFVLQISQRTGKRVQVFQRTSADGRFNSDMPYRLGVFERQ